MKGPAVAILLVVIATPASATPSSLLPPEGLRLSSTPAGIELTWEPAADAVAYGVYRNGLLLGVSEAPQFVDPTPMAASAYAVTAMRDGMESLPSAPVATDPDCFVIDPQNPPFLFFNHEQCPWGPLPA